MPPSVGQDRPGSTVVRNESEISKTVSSPMILGHSVPGLIQLHLAFALGTEWKGQLILGTSLGSRKREDREMTNQGLAIQAFTWK